MEDTNDRGPSQRRGNFGSLYFPEEQGTAGREGKAFCGRTADESHEKEAGGSRKFLWRYP